jgi:hypothetical protein
MLTQRSAGSGGVSVARHGFSQTAVAVSMKLVVAHSGKNCLVPVIGPFLGTRLKFPRPLMLR